MQSIVSYTRRGLVLLRDRPKGWQSLIYNTAMAKAKKVGPLMAPVHVTIEPTNACNARCPVCETGNGSMARRRGMIDIDVYRKFIDDIAPTTSMLMFYFMGEPFLHRKSYEMIRYARNKGLFVETCSNGDFVDPEGVIYADVNEISFQIGGMHQDTHSVYRVRSNFDRIKLNLERLLELRKKTPESNVQINVGFIVMKHNEHEVPAFLRWAKDLGVDRANVIDPCVRTVDEGKIFLPEDRRYWFYDEDAFARGVLKPRHLPDNECTWIWNSVSVNWDGSVVPCCRDPNGRHTLGNAFERPLLEVWNGKAARDFRKRVVNAQRKVDICSLCSGYGVPSLARPKPIGFEVKRLSLDENRIELPEETL